MSQEDKIVKSTGIVSSATLLSRVLGLVREQVYAHLFGAGFSMDAIVAAFRIPHLLRDLFAEGALATAFVPVFTDHLTNKGKKEAFYLGNLVINTLLVILSLVILLGIIFAPFLVNLIAPGFGESPGKIELTTQLTRILFPFLALISLAAVVMGMLNSFGHFATPALAPTMFNIGIIFAGFVFCPFFDPPILGIALGALLGGLGQLGIQIPRVRKEGFRYKPVLNFRDPGLRRILLLMTPAVFGIASTQINIFVATYLASLLPQGSVSYLSYAYRLMYFPLGVFGVAVATVTLPLVSAHAAQNKIDQVLSTYISSLKLVFFLVIPSTIFLIVAAGPIISLLFQHGKFQYLDTVATSKALILYSLGLMGFATIRVTAPVFYALKDTRTPVIISAISVALNIILNLILMRPLGYMGLALATSIAGWVNMFLLLLMLNKKIGPFDFKDLFKAFYAIVLASLIMGGLVWLFFSFYQPDLRIASLTQKILTVLVSIGLGLIAYVSISRLLNVGELKRVLDIFRT
ncbi:MAG: murein biosynthesis integral membrane protein MurJ [Candidatus Zixiibacteriota bacterium]